MDVRLTDRRDGVLLAGIALALLTVFDRSIAWLLDEAHNVELSYGIRLLPALVVLTAIFMAHLHAKRQESRAEAARAALQAHIAQERLRELERLHLLGRQLAGALSMQAIQAALWRHLPGVTEERDAWVAIWNRERVDVVVDTIGRSPEHLEERTRNLLDQWHGGDSVESARRVGDDCCFLLLVAGEPIGVLGVSEREATVSPNTEGVLAAASALIALTIRTVQLFHELRETAVTDSLTGCVNRAHLLEVMSAELRRTARTGSPMSLIMIDLDGFKHVNDQDGHLAGDTALASIGRRMKELLRHSDVRCRYGGDEFLVMLPDTSLNGALHVGEVLRREIEALGIRPSAREAVVTASVGVAAAIPGEIDPVFCIQRADRGLYAAKRDGRNRVAVYEVESVPVREERPVARSA
jgi:diguanylate cyclase (GGDEF)-like protein